MLGQELTLKGSIGDLENNKLSGASILIVENGIGTTSDENGMFIFSNLKKGNYRIQVSFVGYQSKEIKVKLTSNSNITIQLNPISYPIDSVFITASRFHQLESDIPNKISKITKNEIESFPVNNTDDILKSIANVHVNRSWGIFSKNSSVTMRGLEGSSRTLILLDGVPLNKSAGGSINWHMINPDNIEKIEVLKGPASAMYGNNAMAGVIQIFTSTPKEKFSGSVSTIYGSYNTLGTNLLLQSNKVENNRGYYWNISGFYRQGDGYLFEPYEDRDSTSAKLFLNEGALQFKTGYQFNEKSKLEASYTFYDDYRGEGVRVYEEGGKYNAIENHYATLKYETQFKNYQFNILGFYQNEDYKRQNENINNYGEYKLSEDNSLKNDIGLWTSIARQINNKSNIIAGIDLKYGDVNTASYFKTSTDILKYNGNLSFTALFLQYDNELIPEKLKLQTGIRFDYFKFDDGELTVTDPTKNTGFTEDYHEKFESNSWQALSPKIALKYFINKQVNLYTSVSTGFMPPKLDDLCKSGKIRKGFKLANPELGPEKIITYELGSNLIFDKFKIEPAIYYSKGSDFQYFVGTGDYIESDGEMKPVFKRQNISQVEIKGAEIAFHQQISKKISFDLSYAYNQSKISDFHIPDSNSNDLSGKDLMEVSPNSLFAQINYRSKKINLHFSYNFVDEQWADDENSILIDSYSLFNFRIHKEFFNHLNVAFDVQNILDKEYIDRKGYLSPGRYISIELKYKF